LTTRERLIVLLAFVAILLATFLGAVFVGLGLFPKADPAFFKWLIATGVIEIVGVVVWAFRDSLRQRGQISVNLRFQGKLAEDVVLDAEQCRHELRDGTTNQIKPGGKILPTLVEGAWRCALPSTVSPTDYVRLVLVDTDGDRWEFRWFSPLVVTKDATPLPATVQ